MDDAVSHDHGTSFVLTKGWRRQYLRPSPRSRHAGMGVSNPEQTGSETYRSLSSTTRSHPRKESANGPDQKPTLSPKTAPDRNVVQRSPAVLAVPSSCPSYHLVAGAGGGGVPHPGVSRAVAIWCGPIGDESANRNAVAPKRKAKSRRLDDLAFRHVRVFTSQPVRPATDMVARRGSSDPPVQRRSA
jgi:hypothetical protein